LLQEKIIEHHPENRYALLEVAAETEVDSKELEFSKSAVDTNII